MCFPNVKIDVYYTLGTSLADHVLLLKINLFACDKQAIKLTFGLMLATKTHCVHNWQS